MKKERKIRKLIIILVIFFIVFTIPSVYAFYFSNYKSSIFSKYVVDFDLTNSYVRATVLTYWVDTESCDDETDMTTCAIYGKSSWNLRDNIINEDWILLEDGFYYYKDVVNAEEINVSNVKTSNIALIDPELTLADLTDDQVAGINAVPQYEIFYEFISNNDIKDAWNVSYDNGIPEYIN